MSAGAVKAAKWRPTTETDLEAIQTIANVVHPNLSEDPKIFAEKLRLFSEGCFVFVEDGVILGYAFVHPWLLNNIPKLNELLLRIPSKPDCLLIYDVAMLPQARGRGAARGLLERIAKLATEREIPNLVLVSVYNSHLHWAHLGFEPVSSELVADRLNSYGENAWYMVRRLR